MTQQYVKMVQIEACQAKGDAAVRQGRATEATMERKIRELRYAIAMEKKFTKDEILERYLNIAYYGEGAYGVEAAARHYFSTHADRAHPAPRRRCWPAWCRTRTRTTRCDNLSAALDRRDVVINRMAELEADHSGAGQEGQDRQVRPEDGHSRPATAAWAPGIPFLCDYVYRSLLQTPSLGKTVKERENMVKRGGLVIQTAIDPKTQNLAQRRGQ